jgi:Tripartite tricarboxylate transporter TctB family
MQPAQQPPGAESAPHLVPRPAAPRSDFIAALVWIAFGIAVAIASWRMDRLQDQDVNPYTVPGLLPGLLGIALIFFGVLLLLRAWRQGALDPNVPRATPMSAAERRRLAIVLGLCLTFGIGLVGHGLPFWLAAALFVAATISILQYPQRRADHQVVRGFTMAITIGLGAGLAITLVFQELFLVRLP